jgi:hypothetical protein
VGETASEMLVWFLRCVVGLYDGVVCYKLVGTTEFDGLRWVLSILGRFVRF